MTSRVAASPALPPAASRMLERARTELARRQLDAAAQSLANVLSLVPGCVEAVKLSGVVAQMRGEHARAVELLRRAGGAAPRDPGIHMALGISLFETGHAEAAIASLQRAAELAPDAAPVWYNLGKALKLNVQMEAAVAALLRALALDPRHVTARITLADAQASVGRIDEAAANLREVLKRHPGHAHAWFALANMKVVPLGRDDVLQLRRAIEEPGTSTEARILLSFSLAKALEDQGDYAASFEVLQRANAMQRGRITWDAARHRRHVEAIEHAFALPPPAPLDPGLGREVILIVGVPRSGTTLVEQILASHPRIEGANEILDLPNIVEEESSRRGCPFPRWVAAATPQDWQRLGRDYLARTERWRRQRPRFTDKNLVNWELIGAALTMLPGARVIVCRRDPVETCLACYRQWFSHDAEFSYDLDDMADYLIDFERLSRFWQARYPGQVLGLDHESLQSDPEGVIRRLLDFLALPFDPTCLAFHETARTVVSAASAGQVRKPLRRDTARAARYGNRLDGLRLRLAAAGLKSASPEAGWSRAPAARE